MKPTPLKTKPKNKSRTLWAAATTVIAGGVMIVSAKLGIIIPEEHALEIAGGITTGLGVVFSFLRLKTKLPLE